MSILAPLSWTENRQELERYAEVVSFWG